MGSMLIDEAFVAVFPSLVRKLGGMNEAAVVQAIHFRSQVDSRPHDGHYWTPMSAAEIAKATGLSEDAAFRTLVALRALGVLIGAPLEAASRRLWWRINHDALADTPSREVAEPHPAKSRKPSREIAESTTTKNTQEQTKNVLSMQAKVGADQVVKRYVDRFRERHGAEPDRSSIGRLARDAKRMLGEGRTAEQVGDAAERCADDGHANLPSALTRLLATASRQPRGFAGIKAMLDEDRDT